MKNLLFILSVFILVACGKQENKANLEKQDTVSDSLTPEEARIIAKEAYIYGYPMIDNYRIHYAYFVAKDNAEYRAPYNVLTSTARVNTPDDKAVQTPNSDTPYSTAGLDLRTEPIVITVPEIEKNRYYSIQLIDLYTHNFDYIGSRATGNKGGSFMISGPHWKGKIPKGINKVITCETEFALAVFRTQLFNSKDIKNVINIQKSYKLQPLSEFTGQSAPAVAPAVDFILPISSKQLKTSLDFFKVLNFQLQFCPTHSSETTLMKRFSKINVGSGKTFDITKFSPQILAAIKQGMKDAWVDYAQLKEKIDKKEVLPDDLTGSRRSLKNNYLYRMTAAIIGIYGNIKEEAMYPLYTVDADGNPLIGTNKYILKFPAGSFPPVNAFWSLTMYELPSSLLVKNSINRYLVNSPMLSDLKKDADGGLTLYIQHESPGKEKESNWLPSPKASFMCVMRLYWPKEEALTGVWNTPALIKSK
jgi:hypothetical protein